MSNWEYGGAYLKHNMGGVVNLPHGSQLQVCDITQGLPDFMRQADVLFIDPPCSKGNIQSFYTKADLGRAVDFGAFTESLFRHISSIGPKHLFLELFAANMDEYTAKALRLFKHKVVYDSFYYKKKSNRCWIAHFSNDPISPMPGFENVDEEQFIWKLCTEFEYACIGDLCMGTGLVGKYAYRAGRRFVGTELNRKRLAILVDHITEAQRSKLQTATKDAGTAK